jgi:catechol 2,3-dioxygenase-like lactoylglutathione lyase family enzyme
MSEKGIGTNVICQIALIVGDIDRTRRDYADVFQLPVPEIIETGPLSETQANYRGQPTEARAKLAFFNMGEQLNLELIEPIGRPSTWGEYLDTHGEGVHHIAFRVEGTEQVVAYLEGKGMDLVQTGVFPGGRYAYIDSMDKLKVTLELLEGTD